MSAKEELLKQLSEQKSLSELKKPEVVSEWKESLTQLFRQIAEWLAENVAKDVLGVEETPAEIREHALGTYLVPSLKIFAPRGDVVQILPKARIVVGAYGRVDFQCGSKRRILVRKEPGRWQFTRLAPDQGGWAFEDLTESSFWTALQYLLS
jgi:hypothetical protein